MLHLLERTKDLAPVRQNSHRIVKTFEHRLFVETTPADLKDFYISDEVAGQLFMATDGDFPKIVFESVASAINKDTMHCLYATHPIFDNRMTLQNVRRQLIQTIEAVEGCPHSNGMVVYDPGRDRQCYLREMATMQLVDILRMHGSAARLVS